MTPTYAQRRERARTIRLIGWTLIGVGVTAGLIAVYVLFIEVHLIGASASMFTNCGTVVEPFRSPTSYETQACATELGGFAAVAALSGVAGLILAAAGAVLLVRNAAPMRSL